MTIANQTSRVANGALSFERQGLRTRIISCESHSPMKLLTPSLQSDWAWAYLSNFGGGMVSGDDYRLSIKLGEGSKCFITTQASTKIFRAREHEQTSSLLTAELQPGSCLYLIPDPLQPFAGSNYSQVQRFDLQDSTCGVLAVDWFTSGRKARDEHWAFDYFSSRNEVYVDGKMVLSDGLRLTKKDLNRNYRSHTVGSYHCFATAFAFGAGLKDPIQETLGAFTKEQPDRRSPILAAISEVQGGLILRGAGTEFEHLSRYLLNLLQPFITRMDENPLLRKW